MATAWVCGTRWPRHPVRQETASGAHPGRLPASQGVVVAAVGGRQRDRQTDAGRESPDFNTYPPSPGHGEQKCTTLLAFGVRQLP